VAGWRDVCDTRLATELGVAVLACDRARPEVLAPLDDLVVQMADLLDDFPAYRQADVRFHIGLAEASGSAPLVTAMTESQGAMTDLIAYIPHPAEVLTWSNAQHARLLEAIRAGDVAVATKTMTEHLRGTEHVLAGLLP
jgi:DNA-binding FadR family transcriptional regulator